MLITHQINFYSCTTTHKFLDEYMYHGSSGEIYNLFHATAIIVDFK